jgi:hypothetical protein
MTAYYGIILTLLGMLVDLGKRAFSITIAIGISMVMMVGLVTSLSTSSDYYLV